MLSFVGMDSIVESANADVTCERKFIYTEYRNVAHRPRNISVLTAGFYLLNLLNLRGILHGKRTSIVSNRLYAFKLSQARQSTN